VGVSVAAAENAAGITVKTIRNASSAAKSFFMVLAPVSFCACLSLQAAMPHKLYHCSAAIAIIFWT